MPSDDQSAGVLSCARARTLCLTMYTVDVTDTGTLFAQLFVRPVNYKFEENGSAKLSSSFCNSRIHCRVYFAFWRRIFPGRCNESKFRCLEKAALSPVKMPADVTGSIGIEMLWNTQNMSYCCSMISKSHFLSHVASDDCVSWCGAFDLSCRNEHRFIDSPRSPYVSKRFEMYINNFTATFDFMYLCQANCAEPAICTGTNNGLDDAGCW